MATLYYITYDLRLPGQNYQVLWEELAKVGAQRIMDSVWALVWLAPQPVTTAWLYDHFRQFVDANDKVLVIDSRDSTWSGHMAHPLTGSR